MTYPIFKINAFMMKNLTITIFKSTLSLMGFIALATTQLVVGIRTPKNTKAWNDAPSSLDSGAFFMREPFYDRAVSGRFLCTRRSNARLSCHPTFRTVSDRFSLCAKETIYV